MGEIRVADVGFRSCRLIYFKKQTNYTQFGPIHYDKSVVSVSCQRGVVRFFFCTLCFILFLYKRFMISSQVQCYLLGCLRQIWSTKFDKVWKMCLNRNSHKGRRTVFNSFKKVSNFFLTNTSIFHPTNQEKKNKNLTP